MEGFKKLKESLFMEESNIIVRKSHKEWKLEKTEFIKRYKQNFYDPYFDSHLEQINILANIAWKTYEEGRKSPRSIKAGAGYSDPDYELSVEWVATKKAINEAQKEYHNEGPRRILLISGSHRNDHTCPGEISKTIRLVEIAKATLEEQGAIVTLLDLSKLNSEYGKKIHPCKGCVSTAMPLCHWPCSCYPNHSLGQIQDWMNEIYPMWVGSHGVMIVTPVYWHQSPSALKLMIDRLVCADGGNNDPTSTQGKNAELAKKIEMNKWDFPRHLKGRLFSVVVHGDAAGVDESRNALCNWLEEMELIPSANFARIGRYIGYYGPYAESHDALDADVAIQYEVENAAKALVMTIKAQKEKKLDSLIPELDDPRPK